MKRLIIIGLCFVIVLTGIIGCAGKKPKRASLVTRTEDENESVTEGTGNNTDDPDKSGETGEMQDPYEIYKHLLDLPEDVSFDSESFCVINKENQVVLGKEEFERKAPASITKVMTALVTVENISLDTRVMVTEEDLQVDILSSGVYPSLKPGEVFTVEDLLYALLLPSTNAAGNILARACAGNMENFAALMNEKGQHLGLVNSHFMNSHGLDTEGHYSCAYDMALILKEACDNEELKTILGAKEYTLPATEFEGEREMSIGHPMLNGSFSCEGVFAGKTGWSENAESTLLTAVSREESELFICTLYSDDGRCAEDTYNLAEISYASFENRDISLYPLVSDYQVKTITDGVMIVSFKAGNHPESLKVLWFDTERGSDTVVEKTPEVKEGLIEFSMNNLELHRAYTLQLYVINETGQSAVEVHALSTREKISSVMQEIGEASYIFAESGFIKTGSVENEDGCFYADDLGKLEKGLVGGRYYAGEDYRIVSGWIENENEKYYAGPDGRIVTGKYIIDKELYEFDENGVMIR